MPVKKDIIYPIFLECCEHAIDNFWYLLFQDLSYGKTPYGTYINNNFLCCAFKNKEFSYKIERKDIKQLHDEVYNLLTKKLGIASKKDNIKKQLELATFEEEIKENRKKWANIRKKNVKDLLIEIFVTDMKNQHSLDLTQTRNLFSYIFVAMIFKVITSRDIHYDDGKITRIDGINFEESRVIYSRQLYNMEISFVPEILIDKTLVSDNWPKYLSTVRTA